MKSKIKYIKIFLVIYIFINVIIVCNAIGYFLGVGMTSLEAFIIQYFPQRTPITTPLVTTNATQSVSTSPQISPSGPLTRQLLLTDTGKIKQAIIEEEIKVTYYDKHIEITDNIEIYAGDDLKIVSQIEQYNFFEIGRIGQGKLSSEYLNSDNTYSRKTVSFLGYSLVLGVKTEDNNDTENMFIHFLYDKGSKERRYYLLDLNIYQLLGEQKSNDYFPLDLNKVGAFNPLYNYAADKGFVTSKGATILNYQQLPIKIEALESVIEADDIVGVKIYTGKYQGEFYLFVQIPSQYVIILNYRPTLSKYDFIDLSDIGLPQITWATGGQNIYKYYATQRDDKCDMDNLDYLELDLRRYKETGKDKVGNVIYETKYPTTDQYLLQMYSDYKDFVAKSNQTNPVGTAEVVKTFEQFISTHPLIYWKTESGLFIRFKQARYVDVSNCN